MQNKAKIAIFSQNADFVSLFISFTLLKKLFMPWTWFYIVRRVPDMPQKKTLPPEVYHPIIVQCDAYKLPPKNHRSLRNL